MTPPCQAPVEVRQEHLPPLKLVPPAMKETRPRSVIVCLQPYEKITRAAKVELTEVIPARIAITAPEQDGRMDTPPVVTSQALIDGPSPIIAPAPALTPRCEVQANPTKAVLGRPRPSYVLRKERQETALGELPAQAPIQGP